MVNIVVVSHSKKLAEGVVELASQMTDGKVAFGLAAGIDDPENPIGTDPVAIMEAIESVSSDDAILILADMGSAILSTDVALELIDPALAEKVHVCAAPVLEGTVSAAVAAASGMPVEQVINEAHNALIAKYSQLNQLDRLATTDSADNTDETSLPHPDAGDLETITLRIENPNGLHSRPSSVIAKAMNQYDADIMLCKGEKSINAKSVNSIALLSVRCGDEVTLKASGNEARLAVSTFIQLAEDQFGDKTDAAGKSETVKTSEEARMLLASAYLHTPSFPETGREEVTDANSGLTRLQNAISESVSELKELAAYVEKNISEEESGIFSAHKMMLEDGEMFAMVSELVESEDISADQAWLKVVHSMSEEYRSIDDSYLSQRYVDIYDVGIRVLRHFNGEKSTEIRPEGPSVIFADYLLPSEVVALDTEHVKGIRLSELGITSHPALIAKAMGIPVMTGPHDSGLNHGDEVVFSV